jgi:hypothetical protein
MPAPQSKPTPTRAYDPAALNFAQRLIDDQAEIERLKHDCDQWRAKALAAEEQVRQLDMRLALDRKTFDEHTQKTIDLHDRETAKLAASRAAEVGRLTEERDFFKLKHARTIERLHVAGKVILDALSAEPKPEEPKVNLAAIADEIENPNTLGNNQAASACLAGNLGANQSAGTSGYLSEQGPVKPTEN